MLKRNSRLLLGLSMATPLLFAACSDNNIFNPMTDAAGDYQLTVFAGHTIPFTFTIQPGDPTYPNGAAFRVVGGDLLLSENGTFVETNNFVITPTGEAAENQSFTSSGSWTLSGTSLTLNAPPQNGNASRFVTGTLGPNGNNNLTVNYQEDNGAGGVDSFEYVR
jgi:hypothetical protein